MKPLMHRFCMLALAGWFICWGTASNLTAQEEAEEEPLRGICSRDSLENNWPDFQAGFYDLSHGAIQFLKNWRDPIRIEVFFGTWCSDSKREVPRFFQIIDEIQNPAFSYELFGLDRSKRDKEGRAEKYHIERVPTFIFLKNGMEIGRIVETPKVDLETDWANLLEHFQKTGLPMQLDEMLLRESLQVAFLWISTL